MSGSSGAQVLQAYVGAQTDLLISRRQAVIDDAPDAVHKSRVATRRLRSLLRTFRPLLDDTRTEPVRMELRWWAEMLGAPRDAEVLRDRLGAALSGLPQEQLRGPVAERITSELLAAHARSHARLVAEIDGERARALVANLQEFSAHLPALPAAGAAADEALLPWVSAACARVDKAGRRAEQAEGLARLTAWHETRKRAKAARYAGDALVDAFGEPAKRLAAAYTEVTEALGELQDSVVASERLIELARIADAAGESTVTYWALIRQEREHARGFESQGREALQHVDAGGARDWLPAPA